MVSDILKGHSGEVQYIPTDVIRIYPCFKEHPPKAEKMGEKEQYFTETGLLQSEIILDSEGNLIDGYTSYLLAKAHGIQSVPVRYGKRQIIRARHKPGGKLYAWELPGLLIGLISSGDRVLVQTQRGSGGQQWQRLKTMQGMSQSRLRWL